MLKVVFKSLEKAEENIDLVNQPFNERLKLNQLLLEVLFFPINPADLLLLEGKYGTSPQSLPSGLGAECIARVIKKGQKVTKFCIGDIVIPLTRNNWAEKIKITESNVIKVSNKINLLQASMLKVNPATAYLMLNNYVKLNSGDKILQNAANSGVGNYVIQLCNHYNIKTFNVIRRPELIKELKKIGANNIIVDDKENKNDILKKKNQFKLFLDAIGGPKVDYWASHLQDHSTIINYGLLSGKKIQLDTQKVIFKNISLKGFWLSLWLQQMTYKDKFKLYNHLSDLIINNILYTNIEKVFHINNIKKAVKRANTYKRQGKILVSFDKDLINKYN